jgi:DNA-binding NtrC family response regulator
MIRKRSNITRLARLLAASPLPAYALDDRRRIVYCNEALTKWLGLTPRELIGQRCDYHSEAPTAGSSAIAVGLCPPPEAFCGTARVAEIAARDATGQVARRRAQFVPLGDTADGSPGVLVLVASEDVPASAPRAAPNDADSDALHQTLRRLRAASGAFYQVTQIIGASPVVARVREQARLAVAGNARVLLVGPPGSGREYMARAIHYGGSTAGQAPLAPLACNLLDAELLESTIASFAARCAELETAEPASLLLLEVDQLPADAQAVLEGLVCRSELRLRTLATARRPLVMLADQDGFRRDLAFALSTLVIDIPPLAERIADVPLLAQHFLERQNAAGGRQLAGFTREAVEQLAAYPWPGNADELDQFVRQTCARATGPLVQAHDLPERIRLTAAAAARPPRPVETIVLDEFLAEIEKELLQRAFQRAKGNKAKVARLLGVPRARVIRRLQHFGIE